MICNIVSVSGGKDSTALLLLALERSAENLRAVFADTGHEHPKTYEYLEYLSAEVFPIRTVKQDFGAMFERRRRFMQSERCDWPDADRARALELLTPTGIPYLDLCMIKARFPSRKAQFCTDFLKKRPIWEQILEPLLSVSPMPRVLSWQGVRRDESLSRRALPELEPDFGDPETGAGLWNYRPLLDWTAEDVFAKMAEHGVTPNPLYLEGMSRVGCMPCINARKSELREIAKRYPEEIERVAEWERIVSSVSRRGAATFFSQRGLANEDIAFETHGIRSRVEWSKTVLGGSQYDLFSFDEDVPACSSVYGLCE